MSEAKGDLVRLEHALMLLPANNEFMTSMREELVRRGEVVAVSYDLGNGKERRCLFTTTRAVQKVLRDRGETYAE